MGTEAAGRRCGLRGSQLGGARRSGFVGQSGSGRDTTHRHAATPKLTFHTPATLFSTVSQLLTPSLLPSCKYC
ncbi:hypothetical protein E2C01_057859 [Portunus trituberculatus]|uniref:Uncharacterized protein n=1 Tax=Portunus trituberculatus TaxID=210409 RepID=A0A5B7H1M4_PORTR|nr:hypothetical protein [Portunus trituberculatus]